MHTPFTTDILLVSSPNNGGISLVSNQTVTVLDRSDTTGLCLMDTALYRNAMARNCNSKVMQLQTITDFVQVILEQGVQYDFHDILRYEDRLYLVSTGTNEVIILKLNGSEAKRYAYPGGNDSWHINCLGIWDDRVVVSAFGEFDGYRSYKGKTSKQGFILDLESNTKLWEGLSQPHTPIQYRGNYYICNSEEMQVLVKEQDSSITHCIQLDGYTRGIAFSDKFMYVGLSESRNKTDITRHGQSRIVALDIKTREIHGQVFLPFNEIYDIRRIENLSVVPAIFQLADIDTLHEWSAQYANLEIEFNNMRSQFQRVNEHWLAGKMLELIRRIKGDASFGNPDFKSSPPE